MTEYTGFQYLLIDACNNWGGDKWLFSERINWATEHLDHLESLADEAETKPLYIKAVMAIRKAQQGIPTGHLVGLDACCSGISIMSTVTGCVAGATATGLVDPDVRADAYTLTTATMNDILGGGLAVSRKDAKAALMTSCYGSKAKPKEIFGEDTLELDAFYKAVAIVAPGAWELLQELLASWQPYALTHAWKLPDGFCARVKVMSKVEARIEIDELDHCTMSYEYYENIGTKTGLSNAANVVHSLDSYILRCMHRRCNYDMATVLVAYEALLQEMDLRNQGFTDQVERMTNKVGYYVEQYERSDMADIVILPYLHDGMDTQYLSTTHINKLLTIIEYMVSYQPFELVCIHDDIKSHPNICNYVRQQYINIMAELAESNVLSDIISQIHGVAGTYPKLSNNLGGLIRGSNYALS